MIIRDRKKLLRAILIIMGIIVFINILIPDKSFSKPQLKYKTVSVLSGDTLWAIAKVEQEENSYYQGKDVRDIVQDIKRINNLGTANLKVNQTLEIPTY